MSRDDHTAPLFFDGIEDALREVVRALGFFDSAVSAVRMRRSTASRENAATPTRRPSQS